MLYICAKFREIILERYQSYRADTNDQPLTDGRMDGQTDGRTDTQKFGGYNIIPRHFLWRGIKSVAEESHRHNWVLLFPFFLCSFFVNSN